jgi:hypothetical protein
MMRTLAYSIFEPEGASDHAMDFNTFLSAIKHVDSRESDAAFESPYGFARLSQLPCIFPPANSHLWGNFRLQSLIGLRS